MTALNFILTQENRRSLFVPDTLDLSFASEVWQHLIRVKRKKRTKLVRRHLEVQSDGTRSQEGYFVLVVEEILEQLAPQSREMVRLRIDGYEIAEVARKLGRSRRSVERTLQEIRLKMGRLLQEESRDAASSD